MVVCSMPECQTTAGCKCGQKTPPPPKTFEQMFEEFFPSGVQVYIRQNGLWKER